MVEIDQVLGYFVDFNEIELSVLLLKTIAAPEHGGLGYQLSFFHSAIDFDGYEVDERRKIIKVDISGFWGGENSVASVANNLRDALQVKIARTHASVLERYGWGTAKVVLGVVETGVGLIGILIPAPGTTIAGVAVFVLGANSLGDGFSQLAGANRGRGYNVLGEASGAVGAGIAGLGGGNPEVGRMVGQGVFTVVSLVAGSVGSIRILRVPGRTFIRMGVGGQPGGVTLGRLDLLYGSERAQDGMTVISINNNAGQSILRFVTHGGGLVVNGRIVGVERVLDHATDTRTILKGLIKLLVHGARAGW
jgi:hypothetical protein